MAHKSHLVLVNMQKDWKAIVEQKKLEEKNFTLNSENADNDTRKIRWMQNATHAITNLQNNFDNLENFKEEMRQSIVKEVKDLWERNCQEQDEKIENLERKISILVDQNKNDNERMELLENKLKQLEEEMIEQTVEMRDIKRSLAEMEEQEKMLEEQAARLRELTIENRREMPVSRNNIRIEPPIFHGEKYEKPLKFLADMKKYVKTYESGGESIKTLINQCLADSAKDWFYFTETSIETLDDFEKTFKKRYWSETIQDALKRKLEVGSYSKNGKKTRTQYATDLINIAKDVYEEWNEESIIKKVAKHFEREVKMTVMTQRIGKLDLLFELLEELDRDDKYIKKKPYDNSNDNNQKDSYQKPWWKKKKEEEANLGKQQHETKDSSKMYYNSSNKSAEKAKTYETQKNKPKQSEFSSDKRKNVNALQIATEKQPENGETSRQ